MRRSNGSSGSRRKVVIIGAGFAGLSAAKILSCAKDIDVTLLDRKNHHLFQPLLYQVATAGLSPADIAVPIRSLFPSRPGIRVILDEVVRMDLDAKKVFSAKTEYAYDDLIVACGANHSYFGSDHWEEFAPGLKTLEHAIEIRRRVLSAFEEAEKETNAEAARSWLSFVVVGAGPTGVELAGSLAELSRVTLSKDFRRISPDRARIILVEAGPRVLASFSEDSSKIALQDLETLGVQVWTNTRVTNVTAEGVQLGSDFIATHTVFWAAGVEASPLGKALKAETDRAGRVMVNDHLQLQSHPDVYVLGDMASVAWRNGTLPGLAPVAQQQGRYVAAAIQKKMKGRPVAAFRYLDKGSMATIGRNKAVLEFGKLRMSGRLAWAAWLFIHVYYLIGFRNRLLVMMQWAWSYLTYKRGARLIVSRNWRQEPTTGTPKSSVKSEIKGSSQN